MDLHKSVRQLLKEIGSSLITRSAYDTAWIARLDELDDTLGEQALDWLRSHQLADGSWGADEPRYHHDRLICTLTAMTVLARRKEAKDRIRLRRGAVCPGTGTQRAEGGPAGERTGEQTT